MEQNEENITPQVQNEMVEDTVKTENSETQDKHDFQAEEQTNNTSTEEISTYTEEDKEKDLERKILNEVMEKLKVKDAKVTQQKAYHDMALRQQVEKESKNQQLRTMVSNDLTKIEVFLRQGVVTPQQGQVLRN